MAGLQNVLVVEDDVMIRELYRTTLVRDGFHVEIAGDSHEAFEKLKTFKPDIVLLDIMLPGQSGIDILKELRANPEYHCQDKKILMLTNLAQKNLAESAFKIGADGYIVKADILPSDLKNAIASV
jgi:DNA-binding response OmpR family regulator